MFDLGLQDPDGEEGHLIEVAGSGWWGGYSCRGDPDGERGG